MLFTFVGGVYWKEGKVIEKQQHVNPTINNNQPWVNAVDGVESEKYD